MRAKKKDHGVTSICREVQMKKRAKVLLIDDNRDFLKAAEMVLLTTCITGGGNPYWPAGRKLNRRA
jgi:hypothetical protein